MNLKDANPNSQRKLKILYVNVNGLKPRKIKTLVKIILDFNIDIVGIVETWTDKWEGEIPFGYQIFINQSVNNPGLGRSTIGLQILAKTCLGFTCNPFLGNNLMVVENNNMVFILYYRHRFGLGGEFIDEKSLENNLCKRTIVASDMNFSENSNIENSISELLQDHGIFQVKLDKPTYFKGSLKTNPDRIYSNIEVFIEICEHKPRLSDHAVVIITTNDQNTDAYKRRIGTKTLLNEKFILKYKLSLKLKFGKLDLEKVKFMSINQIEKTVTKIMMEHVIASNKRHNQKFQHKTDKNKTEIKPKKKSNIYASHKMVTKAEKRKMTGKSDDKVAADPKERLIDKFVLDGVSPKHNDIVCPMKETDPIKPCTADELKILIKSLPRGKSGGCTGVRNEMLMCLPKVGIRILVILFNRILLEGKIPKNWNKLIIKPIPKPDGSYRPISLTEHLRKLFEIMFLQRLDIKLAKQQGGFVANIGTTEQALIIDNELRRSNGTLIVATLDISKAYDSVDRTILYKKIKGKL